MLLRLCDLVFYDPNIKKINMWFVETGGNKLTKCHINSTNLFISS